MKLTYTLEHVSRKSDQSKIFTPHLITHQGTARRQAKSENIQKFRDSVKKRPSDTAWLIKYGQLARTLDLTYKEALAVVKVQVRKLRGNIRLKWVHEGLKAGYEQTGLVA